MLDIFSGSFFEDINSFLIGIPQNIAKEAQNLTSSVTGFVTGAVSDINNFILSTPQNISDAVDFLTVQNDKITQQFGKNIANVAAGAGTGLSSLGKGSGEFVSGAFNTNPLLIPAVIAGIAVVGIIAFRI